MPGGRARSLAPDGFDSAIGTFGGGEAINSSLPGARQAGQGRGGSTKQCQNKRVRVHVLGVRGSTPAPGPEFVRHGGHTSCVALAHDGHPPNLILDAGTGIRRAAALLSGEPFRGAIVLGHLHWDHTQGIPFFSAGDMAGSVVALYAPAQMDGTNMEAVLARCMSPPHFPIPPSGLRGSWRFAGLEPGVHEIAGFSILALEIPHKGGRTFGYRVSDGRAAVAYLSDHWPTSLGPGPDGLGEYHEAALRLAAEVDVLFHDAQYTDEELPARAFFGHASPGYALNLGARAKARRVVLYHHDPWRTDSQIDDIVAAYHGALPPVEVGREGTVFDLP
jgi:phosphoribosyl 1,2-cyclic phosphodiesterase